MNERGKLNIAEQDKLTVGSILEKVRVAKDPVNNTLAVTSFERLYGLLDNREIRFIERVRNVDARVYGARLPFLGITAPPIDLVAIREQHYLMKAEGKLVEKPIPTQYLPQRTYDAYQRMYEAIIRDLGRGLLVESGYRSPASQAVTLIDLMKRFDFDLGSVFSLAAAVGHSEHGYPPHQAIDFATTTGIGEGGVDERFALTEEKAWLDKNGLGYGFVLSYPKGNADGINYEPWHWSHREK